MLTDGLYLPQTFLNEEGTFKLIAEYPGGRTQQVTLYYESGNLLFFGRNDGDRDGGDVTVPDSITPTIDNSASDRTDFDRKTLSASLLPTSQEAQKEKEAALAPLSSAKNNTGGTEGNVQESETDTQSIILGRHLRELAALSGDQVSFGKQGITLHLPVSTLQALDFGDNGPVVVTLRWSGADTIVVGLSANGEEITALPGAVIQLDREVKQLYRISDGTVIQADDENLPDNAFPISSAGEYRIISDSPTAAAAVSPASSAPNSSRDSSAVALICALAAAAGFGGFVLYRRRCTK